MVQLRTVLLVADNSGVKQARRIQVLKTKSRPGLIGDLLVASVLKALPEIQLKKGDLVRGYLVRSVYGHHRSTGVRLAYPNNHIVRVNKKGEPMGSRVRLALPADLRRKGLQKLRSLCPQRV